MCGNTYHKYSFQYLPLSEMLVYCTILISDNGIKCMFQRWTRRFSAILWLFCAHMIILAINSFKKIIIIHFMEIQYLEQWRNFEIGFAIFQLAVCIAMHVCSYNDFFNLDLLICSQFFNTKTNFFQQFLMLRFHHGRFGWFHHRFLSKDKRMHI